MSKLVNPTDCKFDIDVASVEQKAVIDNLLQLCLHELSTYGDGIDLGPDGRYDYEYLDLYWTEEGRHPFVLTCNRQIAGFALIRIGALNSVAEFFVLRRFRRIGLGAWAAQTLFAKFPGEWEVHEMTGNDEAVAFWRRCVPGSFGEESTIDGTVQRFVMP